MADIGRMFGAPDRAETFLGVPRASPADCAGARVAILGAPCVTPYVSVGAYCADGPAAIRAASVAYAANRGHVNFDIDLPPFAEGSVVDCGDIPGDPETPEENRARLAAAVTAVVGQGAVPVVIGGDDSGPIPVFGAFAGRGTHSLLQIDAHIDWRDAVAGERLGLSSTMRRVSEMDHIGTMVQVGQRGIGSARVEDLAAARERATLVGAARLTREGSGAALAALPEGVPVLLALDWDALDPSVMPSVIGRTPGGLSYWQVLGLIEAAHAQGGIAGFCAMEFMPGRDIDGLGGMLAAQMLASVCGLLAGDL